MSLLSESSPPNLSEWLPLIQLKTSRIGVEVSAGDWAADGVGQGEESADGDLRQRRRALDRERRTQIGKRGRGQV